jgi:hypothetical protein
VQHTQAATATHKSSHIIGNIKNVRIWTGSPQGYGRREPKDNLIRERERRKLLGWTPLHTQVDKRWYTHINNAEKRMLHNPNGLYLFEHHHLFFFCRTTPTNQWWCRPLKPRCWERDNTSHTHSEKATHTQVNPQYTTIPPNYQQKNVTHFLYTNNNIHTREKKKKKKDKPLEQFWHHKVSIKSRHSMAIIGPSRK